MEIVYKKVNDLIPYINNSRTHSEEQVNQIVASINEFGFTNPLLIDEKDNIIAGHGRLLASKKLKMEEVPCIVLSGLTEAQKKAYIIADNKMALNAGWDEELLKIELESLKELNFDLELTGFNVDELDDIFQVEEEQEIVEDDFDIEPPEEPKAKLGDIYQLGNHRLMCGDSTKIEDVEKLMNGNKADMVFTDPPYGMNLDTDFSGMKNKLDFAKEKGFTGGKNMSKE
jgi:16S rRNA G966 N2-methylase RsmD